MVSMRYKKNIIKYSLLSRALRFRKEASLKCLDFVQANKHEAAKNGSLCKME